MANPKEPKQWTISSRDWGITAAEAGDILITATEIKSNKSLYKAAIADLKARKKAIETVT